MPSVEPQRLAFGVSGHRHDPHGAMGLVVDPAVNALKALVGLIAQKGTAAGSEPLRLAALACPPPIPTFDRNVAAQSPRR